MMAGRQLTLMLLGALLSTILGCKNHNEIVESELRARDLQLRELMDEFSRSQAYNVALEREVVSLRTGQPMLPEQAAPLFGLQRITLGRATGGYDHDGIPGDEALAVLLEPRDSENHIVKAPGALHITALEITPGGVKVPASSWEVRPEQLRTTWKQGLLSTGYYLILPWKKCPQTPQVRVVARFVLPDGRVFETDRDLTIRPLPLPTVPVVESSSRPVREKSDLATVGHWQPRSLQGAVQLGTPVPRSPDAPPVFSIPLR